MQTEIDPRDLIGHKAVDRNGDKIGTVDEVYLDDATGQPEWAAVRTGLFGRDAFVPLTTSEFVSDELRVPYDKSQVKDSPDFGAGQHLSPTQELQLYRYYGLEVPAAEDGHNGAAAKAAADAAPAGAGAGAPATATAAATAPAGAGAPAAAASTVMAAAATTMPAAAARPTSQPTAPSMSPPASQPMAAPVARTTAAPTPPPMAAPQPNRVDGGRTSAFMSAPAPATSSAPASPPAATTAPRPTIGPDPLTDPLTGPPARPQSGTAGADTTRAPIGDPGQAGVPEPIEFVCREERLDVSTEWRVLGRARLRKYVTAEQVERRVPVIRERIRVERVPVGAEERNQLTDQEISESTEEVTLHEQRAVVRKLVVPVERIRLVTERFTEEEVVRAELHREHIQVQDSTRPAGPTAVPGTGPSASSAGASTQSAPSAASSTPPARPDLPTGHAIGA